MTQVTVRLTDDLGRGLDDAVRRLKLRRSDIVRLALERFLGEIGASGRPFDRVSDLIGSYESGIPDLGSDHRKHLLKRLKRA
jgi:Arc/MetJ-type ribon-helix-helix transcriptional regulator